MGSDPSEIIEGPWAEDCDLPVLIEPGKYEAVYVRHTVRKIFDKDRLVIEWRITEPGPAFGVLLESFYVIERTGARRWSYKKYSKLALDVVRLFPYFRRSRKYLQGVLKDLFRGKLFVVSVVTVEKDNRQKPHEMGYSKVDRIVRVVQE